MRKYKWELLLFIGTSFYGIAYSFMAIVGKELSPFTINFIKTGIGSLLLLAFALKEKERNYKQLIIGSFLVSLTLVFSLYCQQVSADKTASAKVGFITSMYIMFVPILAYVFYKKKPSKMALFSILLSLFGLYLLCNLSSLDINKYDFVVLGGALGFAFEIILIDYFSKSLKPISFTACTLMFTSLISLVAALILEDVSLTKILPFYKELLMLGIFCTGLANLAQFVGQKHINETTASIIMSLESVISAIAGFVFLNQTLSTKEILGCVIVFIAVILCQIKKPNE